MRFVYDITGVGWAVGYIEINGQKCEFSPGYLSDALGDLMEAVLDIISGNGQFGDPFPSSHFTWYEEPIKKHWMIVGLNESEIKVTIISKDSTDPTYEEVEMDTTCGIFEFANEVVQAAEELLRKHGLIGYKMTWHDKDFPITTYLRVKYYLSHTGLFPSKEVKEGRREYSVTRLEDELEILYKALWDVTK